MNIEQMTQKTREALQAAQRIAVEYSNNAGQRLDLLQGRLGKGIGVNAKGLQQLRDKPVLLLGKGEFAQLGEGKVLFNTSIGPGFDSAALEDWLTLPSTHFFCDTRAAAGPVGEGFFERENVHCANVSAGRTKQAFVLLSQKVLANLRTALGE